MAAAKTFFCDQAPQQCSGLGNVGFKSLDWNQQEKRNACVRFVDLHTNMGVNCNGEPSGGHRGIYVHQAFNFHLVKNIILFHCFSLLALKGIYDYWTYSCFFSPGVLWKLSRGLDQMEVTEFFLKVHSRRLEDPGCPCRVGNPQTLHRPQVKAAPNIAPPHPWLSCVIPWTTSCAPA